MLSDAKKLEIIVFMLDSHERAKEESSDRYRSDPGYLIEAIVAVVGGQTADDSHVVRHFLEAK